MSSNRSRIAAPFVVTGLIAAGALVPTLRASASPHLPSITPQQLVAKVLDQRVSHLSGTFDWTANLGLPSLSALTSGGGQNVSTSSGFDPTSLLSGTHAFTIWIDGQSEQRIASPGTLSETDLVHRGNQAWLYDSSTDHVTHYVLRGHGIRSAAMPALPMQNVSVTTLADALVRGARSAGSLVSVSKPVKVAGRSAYVLRLAPNRSITANRVSTVRAVTVAVDAATGLALRVSVYAVGQSGPALQVGFTSISYSTPSASTFAAPRGQTTSTKVVGTPMAAHPQQRVVRHRSGSAAAGRTAAHRTSAGGAWGAIGDFSSGRMTTGATAAELDSVSTVVQGKWGSGRLVQSSLVNALILNSGRVLVGAVTPAALEAAAGRLTH